MKLIKLFSLTLLPFRKTKNLILFKKLTSYKPQPLIKTSDGTVQCSTKGNLYYKEFFDVDIHPKKAKLLWEKLHESRDELLVFDTHYLYRHGNKRNIPTATQPNVPVQ